MGTVKRTVWQPDFPNGTTFAIRRMEHVPFAQPNQRCYKTAQQTETNGPAQPKRSAISPTIGAPIAASIAIAGVRTP